MSVAGDKLDNRSANAAIFARTLDCSRDAFEERRRAHDALKRPVVTELLADVEHLAVEPEGWRLVHECGDIEIIERHGNATPLVTTRQRSRERQTGLLIKRAFPDLTFVNREGSAK